VGAQRPECRHEDGAPGERGPLWGQGRLDRLPPGVVSRVDGHALVSARRYAWAQLRCSACGALCTATLPASVRPDTDSPRARAALALGRALLGLPWDRLAASHAMGGGPVPDATPGEQVATRADGVSPLEAYLLVVAAQGAGISHDETTARL